VERLNRKALKRPRKTNTEGVDVTCWGRLFQLQAAATGTLNAPIKRLPSNQIKSNQIALLAKAPLIRSTGAPSTGLQLPNIEQYNAYKQEV